MKDAGFCWVPNAVISRQSWFTSKELRFLLIFFRMFPKQGRAVVTHKTWTDTTGLPKRAMGVVVTNLVKRGWLIPHGNRLSREYSWDHACFLRSTDPGKDK